MTAVLYPPERMEALSFPMGEYPGRVDYNTVNTTFVAQEEPYNYQMLSEAHEHDPSLAQRFPEPTCRTEVPSDPPPVVVTGHHPTQMCNPTALNSYRGEIMQAAQRRDLTRLKIMISTLVHHHRLTPKDLDACLVLHYVVWVGELNDIAEFLISLGCDPYFPDINGDTVFHYTVRGCNLEFLRSLFNIYGLRTLEVLNNNHFNLFLTAASESSDEKAYDILNVLEWLYLNGCSLESQDANGKTGLMWACQRGSLTLVQWFLSRGANLAHRDHNGRTVLQMACVSGDEDTVRTICEAGAIALLDCESNDEKESNTALKLCWNKGHFFLALSLRQWYFQKRLFGCMRVFRSSYASYYWCLMGANFVLFISMAMTLIQQHYGYWYHCFIFLALFSLSQLFWFIAFKADPGYVKQNVIPDQSYRCSLSFRNDLNQRPVFGYRLTSACYKLQLLERDLAWISAELTALNRHFGIPHDTAVQLPPDAERKFETCVLKIQRVREQMFSLMEKVGQERCMSCPKNYAQQVLMGTPKRVCLTCRIVKPFRAHHCGDCAHCVHRFDHHCIWVDNCIGEGNQRSFLVFLLLLTLSIGYLWFLVGMYYASHISSRPDDAFDLFTEPLFYVALTNSLCNLLWAGFVGYLFGRTFKSMCTNITFYEYLKKPPHIQQRFHGQVYTCFWDLADLTPMKVLRNVYGFWSLTSRWDKEDYPYRFTKDVAGCSPSTLMNANVAPHEGGGSAHNESYFQPQEDVALRMMYGEEQHGEYQRLKNGSAGFDCHAQQYDIRQTLQSRGRLTLSTPYASQKRAGPRNQQQPHYSETEMKNLSGTSSMHYLTLPDHVKPFSNYAFSGKTQQQQQHRDASAHFTESTTNATHQSSVESI